MGHARDNLRPFELPAHSTSASDRALYLIAAAEASDLPSRQLLLQALCEGLSANCAGIAKYDEESNSVLVRTFHSTQVFEPPEPIALEHSPARAIYEERLSEVRVADAVTTLFPEFAAGLGAHTPNAYWAIPIEVPNSPRTSHLFVVSHHTLPKRSEPGRSLLKIVANRIAEHDDGHEVTRRKLHGYHQLTSALHDHLVSLDRDFNLQVVNAAFIATMGRTRGKLIGRPLYDFCNRNHFRNRLRPVLTRVLEGTPIHKQVWLDLAGHGRTQFYDSRWDPIRDDTGDIIGVAAVLRDITERKHYQDKIRSLSRHVSIRSGDFEHFAEAATALFADPDTGTSVGIWRRDRENQTLCCVDQFDPAKMAHGSEPDLDVDATIRYLAHFDNRDLVSAWTADDGTLLPAARRRDLARAQIATVLEAPIRVGGRLEGFVSLARRRAHGGWHPELRSAIIDLADLAARALINEERVEIDRRIQSSAKIESLGALAGGVAHDFNNLLVGVLGAAELAREELPDDSSARQYLEIIQQSSERATALCRQMLAYSGRGTLKAKKLDLSRIAQETVDILRSSLPRNAELRFEATAENASIEVDGTQIRQVIMNLITNAADATEGRPGHVSVTTGVWSGSLAALPNLVLRPDRISDRYAYVEVQDDGCGMAEETLARMFDPFFTTKITGRGLGLAATLGIVRVHQGAITISTAPGLGTTIRVLLPGLAEELEEAVQAPEPTDRVLCDGHVLVVDDDPAVGRVAAAMLRRAGLQSVVIADGLEAIECFRSRRFDAVLLDLTMPGLGGEEVGRRLKQIDPDVPIILSTGFGDSDSLGDELDEFETFLPKPYSQASLERVLIELNLSQSTIR